MMGLFCAVLVAVCAKGTQTRAAAPKRPPKLRAYPLYCAGIVVGMSNERDVRRLYGPGFFAPDEGHLGGRYYVDPSHRVTLHVETGVDRIIERVEFGSGVRLPKGAAGTKAIHQAEARWLHPDESVGPGYRLGATRTELLQELGPPAADRRTATEEVLRYDTGIEENPYTLVYEAEFRFRKGKLDRVSLYNGE
jgi:hypothetical protein